MQNNQCEHTPIKECKDILLKIISCGEQEAEKILLESDYQTINTVTLTMIAGRDYIYTHRKKVVQNPEKVLNSWEQHCGSLLSSNNSKEKAGDIDYILGKIDYVEFITRALYVFGVI